MSREIIYNDNKITVVKGIDHAVGKFAQIFDKSMETETPEGEGLVYDWSQLFGVETNYTGYPDRISPDEVIKQYIDEFSDETNNSNENENNKK